MSSIKKVLFVCIENSNRSQMAEAFARMLGGDEVIACSAGSSPSGTINPKAIESMRDYSYDLSSHRSESLDQFEQQRFDAVITMGCGDNCAHIAAVKQDDWALADPKNLAPEDYVKIRDSIAQKVEQLLLELDVPVQPLQLQALK